MFYGGRIVKYEYVLLFLASSLLAAMDRSANPCTDFFQFACGTWNKKHVIPEDRSSISTFEVLADQLQVILKGKICKGFFFLLDLDFKRKI